MPDGADDVELLRGYVRALYDAGYRLDRFSTEPGDPYQQRILEQELGAAGVPHVLGNPLVAGALKHFGTDEQRAEYFPPMAAGEHIWTQLFSEPDAGSDLTSLQTRATLVGDEYVVVGPEGLEHLGPVGGLRLPAGAHRARRGCRRHHRVHPRHAQSRCRRPPAPRDDRHDRLQRGLLRRGADPGRPTSSAPPARAGGSPAPAWPRSARVSAVPVAVAGTTRCSGWSTWPGAPGGRAARPSRTVRSVSRSGTWRPGPASSATWVNASPRRRCKGQITPADAPIAEDLVQRAQPAR